MFAGHIGAALAIEALIAVGGLTAYLHGSGWPRGRRITFPLLLLAILAFTVIGMTVAPPPPSISAMAASSLATIALVTAAASWVGRLRS